MFRREWILLVVSAACAPAAAPPPATPAPAETSPASAPPPPRAEEEEESAPDDSPIPAYKGGPTPVVTAPHNQPGPTPQDEKACAARGGKLQPVCMLGNFECIFRHRDAGKRCRAKKDCVGQCLYEGPQPAPPNPVGVCERTNDPCGCKAPIVGGRAQPMMCTD